MSGGQIGGYQSFISQVLETSQKNLSALAKTFATEANNIQKNGIDGYGQVGQDLFAFAPGVVPDAAAIRLALSDGMRVSTAAQFRVSEGNTNVTTTKASVKFTGSTPVTALGNSKLVNNPNKTAGVTFKVDGASTFSPVTTLSAGVKATFYLDDAEPGQQLQVLTRDGRQLLGQALTETEKYQLLKPANGFSTNANYSDAYLNKTGVDAYRNLDLFYGAKGTVQYSQNFDQNGVAGAKLPTPAVLESGRINSADFEVAAGAFVLNHVGLTKFTPDSKTNITITSLNVAPTGPSAINPTFNFSAVVGDRKIHVDSNATQSLTSLKDDLNTKLASEGLLVTLIHNGEDLQITDARGRDISAVSLTPTTQGTLSNVDFGSSATSGFSTFTATLDGKDFKVDVSKAQNLNEVITQIQAALRTGDKQSADALTVSLVANGGTQDLLISDVLGRSLGNVQLISKDLSTGGASTGVYVNTADLTASGHVDVSSPATQMAQWINGTSIAQVIAPTFGNAPPGGSFKQFNATFGGVSYSVDLSGVANDISSLAKALQKKLRAIDQSANISVEVQAISSDATDAGQFKIVDAAGREIKDVTLVPQDGSEATPGRVLIDNSTLSQTNVRAEVFSEVRVPVSQLQLNKKLIINGQEIPSAKSVEELVKGINQSAAGVRASVAAGGELVIENPQGGAIRINSLPDGNALNIQPGTYSAQIRMTQVVRDLRVAASGVDYKKPLQINGVSMSESTYKLDVSDASISHNFQIDFGYPVTSVSAGTAQGLADAINQNSTISQGYKADVDDQGRLRISALDPSVSDANIADMFVVKDVSTSTPITLSPASSMQNIKDLMARINAHTLDVMQNGVIVSKGSGVVATLDDNGDLKLSTTDPSGTRDISIGPGKDTSGQYAPNALGIEPLDYTVSTRLKNILADEPYKSDIRLTFGSYTDGNMQKSGDPALLAKVGFRTGAYIEGGSPDDLLLFVTGKGSANVAVGYSGQSDSKRDSLRSQSLMVKFTAVDRYSIIDTKTGTELADRQYDPSVLEPVIDFEGLQIKLSHAPSVGDSYTIDGNYDGMGNNVNILDMAALSKTPVTNGKTISNTYIDQINTVGNLAEQANITQQALTVVNDQAIASRDKVSGVNLDEEAAALIRYQQAYQACAKALQISGQLFDTINQIR